MSSTNIRDPVVDANPDLPRKRERLSEENDTTLPLSTADEGILVEALPLEELGASFENAIELHDEPTMTTTAFSYGFELQPGVEITPVAQLDILINLTAGTCALEPVYVDSLARWIINHVRDTQGQDETWRVAYLEETEFFSKLGQACWAVMDFPDDLFEASTLAQYGPDALGDSLSRFLPALTELSMRFLSLLPNVVDPLVARRDSGQVAKTRQNIGFLWYMQILAQTLVLHRCATVDYLRNKFHLKPKAMARNQQAHFIADRSASSSLVQVLQKLAQHHREVSNAWDGIDAALRIIRELPAGSYEEVQRVMDTVHHHTLPVICEKHPRALPEGFHELLVGVGEDLLQDLCSSGDLEGALALYDRYVKCDDDALLPETTREAPLSTLLQEISNGNSRTLCEMLTTAWTLKAFKLFIYSEIMDVRSCGIALLSKRLLELYKKHQPSKESLEHPVLQYVARFMRSNELTKYIFGPNSHASLVNHSQNIISFLAATSAYTDLETDIIWHACTNSVEAEFVKASFVVLVDLCRYLDLDHLVYLANKFAITPPSKLGKDAVESLTDLFQRVQIKSGESTDQRHRLATAFISIDIMMQIGESEDNLSLVRLRDVARSELERFTDPAYSAEDRVQIYSRCAPALVQHSKHATMSVEILVLFLRTRQSAEEAETLLGMLPIQAVVAELGQYVKDHQQESGRQHESCARAIEVRIEAIIRLMSLLDKPVGEDVVSQFFRYTIGNLALSNACRDRSWQMLMALASHTDLALTAGELLHRFLAEEAAQLPIEFMTPELIKLFGIQLKKDCEAQPITDDFSLLLDSAIWKKLVQTAESIDTSSMSQHAMQMICETLFDTQIHQQSEENVAKCHAKFAGLQITRICQEAASLSLDDAGSISPKLSLLYAALERSNQALRTSSSEAQAQILLASGSENEPLQCIVQVYSGGMTHPKLFHLQAKMSNTLSDLLNELPAVTGAAENRIILSGKSLDLIADAKKTMLDLGIHSSSAIAVCPRYTFTSDLGLVWSAPGSVEREVLDRYDELERLLDGPHDIAQQVYFFLCRFRPPAPTRQQVISRDNDANVLCPRTKPWRTMFSLFALKSHLADFAQLGVADHEFLLRGIALCVSVLCEKSRASHTAIVQMALVCLVAFLQEQPNTTTPAPISEPATFATRMVDLCFEILGQQPGSQLTALQTRQQIVELMFRTLLQAFRRQSSVWNSFTQDARILEMHKQALFGSDLTLSTTLMHTIKNFCADPSSEEGVADFYLKTLLDLLPQGLAQRERAFQFFDLATQVLIANRTLRRDEPRVREITAALVTTLWNYEHVENVNLPITDTAVTGLLRLLLEAVTVLKSFKKPLALLGVSSQIFDKLLFPPYKDQSARPLVHQQSRRLAFQLVQATCETRDDYTSLLLASMRPLHDGDGNPNAKYPGPASWLRPVWKCSGLTNLGMTCYMNSLLQQLFANLQFREFLLQTPIVDVQRQALLVQVQALFASMQDSYACWAETLELAKVLSIQTDSQEDVHGFYEDFLSRLEANMPDTETKLKLTRFFTGKLIAQIKGECGHISPKTEPFVDLPVIVKNKPGLPESLDEFVQGEPMEGANKYKCLACDSADGGRLVNAMRRACLEEIPDNLTFCLKRFTFEAMLGMDGKVNDRFEFPQIIDMSKYQRAHLEDPVAKVDEDIFELVGVIVHQGTLHLGHYWSYTLLRNTAMSASRTWVKLEDRNVTLVQGGLVEVQQECFGGQRYSNGNERADNAYVLFYQRRSSLEQQIAVPGLDVDPITQVQMPPKVPVPPVQARRLQEDNAWKHRIAHLFEDEFSSFILWLLGNYDNYRAHSPAPSDSGLPDDGESLEAPLDAFDQSISDDLLQQTSQVAIAYIQRIAVGDQAPMKRLQPCIVQLKKLIVEQSAFVVPLMQRLVDDPDWFARFFDHESKEVRMLIIDLIIECLGLLRQQDVQVYQHVVTTLLSAAASRVRDPAQLHRAQLSTYSRFVSQLASLGPAETAAVLDQGYWIWALEMLRLPYDSSLRKTYPNVVDQLRTSSLNAVAIYDLLFQLLSGYVDVSDAAGAAQEGLHVVVNDTVPLLRPEIEALLFSSRPGLATQSVYYWLRSAKMAAKRLNWKESAPGQLLGILVSDQTDPQLRECFERSLNIYIDIEEESLRSILHLVLHFYLNCDERESVFKTLVKVIPFWTDSEVEFLETAREAYALAPCIVLKSLEGWAIKFLTAKTDRARRRAGEWLVDSFDCDPISGNNELDYTRANQARKLVVACVPALEHSFAASESRARYEPMIQTILTIGRYMRGLRNKVTAMLNSDEEDVRTSVSPQLRAEADELNALLRSIKELDDDILTHWELSRSALPGTSHDVRRSVELDPEEELETESEWGEEEDDDDGDSTVAAR